VEGNQRPGTQEKVQFPKGEVVEAKAQVWSNVRVGVLLVGQPDVQADGLGPDVIGSTVGGLYHAGGDAQAAAHVAGAGARGQRPFTLVADGEGFFTAVACVDSVRIP